MPGREGTSPQQDAKGRDTSKDAGSTDIKATMSPGRRLWHDRNFNIFWAGQSFDALGDSLSLVIIPLLVLEVTGSVSQMGFVTATIGAGSLISTFVSGIIVDRANRRKVMIFSDIGRTAVYSLIPITWFLLSPSLWLIYVVAGGAAFLNISFNLAYNTATPNIVDQDQITNANGRLQTMVAVAYVAGPVLAGYSSRMAGPVWGVQLISLSYLTSALLMFMVRLRKSSAAPSAEDESTKQASRLDEFLAGMRFLLRHPVLRPATLILAAFIFFSDITLDLSIFRLKHDLNQNDHAIGIVFGIASLGAILAGGVASTLRKKFGFGLCFLGSLILQATAIAATGVAGTVTVMGLLATLFTFGLTFRIICIMSLRQQVTPDRLLGRVTSALYTLTLVTGAVGTALAGVVAEKVGARPVLIFTGSMCVVAASLGFFTAARSARPEKAAADVSDSGGPGQILPAPEATIEA
jgi:MFS family permease